MSVEIAFWGPLLCFERVHAGNGAFLSWRCRIFGHFSPTVATTANIIFAGKEQKKSFSLVRDFKRPFFALLTTGDKTRFSPSSKNCFRLPIGNVDSSTGETVNEGRQDGGRPVGHVRAVPDARNRPLLRPASHGQRHRLEGHHHASRVPREATRKPHGKLSPKIESLVSQSKSLVYIKVGHFFSSFFLLLDLFQIPFADEKKVRRKDDCLFPSRVKWGKKGKKGAFESSRPYVHTRDVTARMYMIFSGIVDSNVRLAAHVGRSLHVHDRFALRGASLGPHRRLDSKAKTAQTFRFGGLRLPDLHRTASDAYRLSHSQW